MARPHEYPIFERWYQTQKWILECTGKMPVKVRFSVSTRIANVSLDITERLLEAIYSKDRKRLLERVNLLLEKLRILFRVSKDGNYISEKSYTYIVEALFEVGKMNGGWLKQCEG
jgi:hypothetical protein